jgi:Kef-type K+ transport system membrane component KefB
MSWTFPLFDPSQPLQWNALLLFGSLLLLGLIGGYLVSRNPWIPRITGYLLVGFVVGESGLQWLSGDILKIAHIFADIALALVVYQLGRYVDIGWLRHERWLLATVVSGAALCFAFVWGALELLGVARPLAMLAGVFAIGTAPGVIMVVVRDLGAEGQVTRRLAAMTALNNLIALVSAYMVLPLIATEADIPLRTLLSSTVYSIFGSALLAYLTYRLMMPLARLLGRERSRQFVLVWDRPGSDAPVYDGPKFPPEDVADGIVAAIEGDRFETYVPDLGAVVEGKTKDVDGFLAGVAQMGRS